VKFLFGHEVVRLRDVLQQEAADSIGLQFAHEHRCVLATCNRDDFVELARRQPHHGIIVIVRRRTRAAEPRQRGLSLGLRKPIGKVGASLTAQRLKRFFNHPIFASRF
jgi:hypothetical protein